MNTQEIITQYLVGYGSIMIILVGFMVWLFTIIRSLKIENKQLKKALSNISERNSNNTILYKNELTIMYSFVEKQNYRVPTKLFNKVRDLGCKNNLVQEIIVFFQLNYNINIYLYGYTSKNHIIGVETLDGAFVVHGENSILDTYVRGIEEAMRLIEQYEIKQIVTTKISNNE